MALNSPGTSKEFLSANITNDLMKKHLLPMQVVTYSLVGMQTAGASFPLKI